MTNSCREQSHPSRLAAEPVGVGADDSQGKEEQRGQTASRTTLPSDWRCEVSYTGWWRWQLRDPLGCSHPRVFIHRHAWALLRKSCSAFEHQVLTGSSWSPGEWQFVLGSWWSPAGFTSCICRYCFKMFSWGTVTVAPERCWFPASACFPP